MRRFSAVLCAAAFGASLAAAQTGIPRITVQDFGPVAPDKGYIPSYPRDHFTPAYLGNGLLGIRPNPNPLTQAKTVAAGYVYSHPTGGFEMFSPAPYPLGLDIRLGESSLLGSPDRVKVLAQTLDMSNGELTTSLNFTAANGTLLDVEVVQFASRSVPSLLCEEARIAASADTTIELRPAILRDGVPGTVYRDTLPNRRVAVDQVLGIQSDRGSKLGIALFIPPEDGLERTSPGGFHLALKRREARQFRIVAAMVTGVYDPAPDLEAIRLASWGGMIGFDELRARNRAAWGELWQSRVKVSGDEQAQRALDAAFFYLHSSAHPSLVTGVAPFGTSQWADYFGHVFWDMDHWIMPAVLPADPQSARAMVEFRVRGLDAAKKRAASFGFRGAMYPWETGIDGSDVTPPEAATGWSEQHTIPEVAIAAWDYYAATGDAEFLRSGGWPVIRDVAEWIASRGVFTKRGYEILNVMGHNEGATNVRNDSQVNMLCRMAMQAALHCARAVGVEAPPQWAEVERAIYIPMDKDKQIILPFSLDTPIRFYNEKLDRYEETDAVANPRAYTLNNMQILFFHDPPIAPDVYRRTWDHEEQLRAARPSDPGVPASVRSPGFTIPPLAALAAFFGDRRKAADLFHLAASEYTAPPYMISKEYRPYKDGNYLMNQASLLMAAMYGFTGLRISEGDWRKYPATLPAGWTRIEIDRMWIRGKPFRMTAEQGKQATLEPLTPTEGR